MYLIKPRHSTLVVPGVSPQKRNCFHPQKAKAKGIEIIQNQNFFDNKCKLAIEKLLADDEHSLEIKAAVIIQKNWRLYKSRKCFRTFIALKRRNISPFFGILLLNTNISSDKKKKFFDSLKTNPYVKRMLPGNHKLVSSEYNYITEQLCVPKAIDEQKVIMFVKKMYTSLMRKMTEEWLFIAMRSKHEDKKNFKLDVMNRSRFGSFYYAFIMWRKYTADKRNKNIKSSAKIEPFKKYETIKSKKLKIIENAEEQKNKMIKKRVLNALHNNIIQEAQKTKELADADQFKNSQLMKLTVNAWNRYINNNIVNTNTKRRVLFNWFKYSSKKKHLRMVKEAYKSRHEYFMKRKGLSAFIKNRRAEQIIKVYRVNELKKHSSKALWFIWCLTGNKYEESFTLAFNAWLSYTKRRKAWINFVYNNMKQSVYGTLLKKALGSFKKQKAYIVPRSLTSQAFKTESEIIYTKSFKEESSTFKLPSCDTVSQDEHSNTNSGEEFMKAFLKTENDSSLFIRVAALSKARNIPKTQFKNMNADDKYKMVIEQSMKFFADNGFDSEVTFKCILNTMKNNERIAESNRRKCNQRDNIIIGFISARQAAEKFHDVNEQFSLGLTDKDIEKRNELVASVSLSDESSLYEATKAVHSIKDLRFNEFQGCRRKIKPYTPNIPLFNLKEMNGALMNDSYRLNIFKGIGQQRAKNATDAFKIETNMKIKNRPTTVRDMRVSNRLNEMFQSTSKRRQKTSATARSDLLDDNQEQCNEKNAVSKIQLTPMKLGYAKIIFNKSVFQSFGKKAEEQKDQSTNAEEKQEELEKAKKEEEDREDQPDFVAKQEEGETKDGDKSKNKSHDSLVIDNIATKNDKLSSAFSEKITRTINNDKYQSKAFYAKQYELFADLLFGSGKHMELPNSINNLRRNLYCMMFGIRPNSSTSTPMKEGNESGRNEAYNIGMLIEKYREDRRREIEEEEDNKEESPSKIIKKKRKGKKNQTETVTATQLEAKYTSRRYYGKNEEDEEEYSESDYSYTYDYEYEYEEEEEISENGERRLVLKKIKTKKKVPRRKRKVKRYLTEAEKEEWRKAHPNEEAPEYIEEYEYEEEEYSSDFYQEEAEYEDDSQSSEATGRIKLKKYKKTPYRNSQTLRAVDNIVKEYVQVSLKNDSTLSLLVELDPLDEEDENSKQKNDENEKNNSNNDEKQQTQTNTIKKRKGIIHPLPKRKKKGPIVIGDNTFSNKNESMEKITKRSNEVSKLIFTKGKTFKVSKKPKLPPLKLKEDEVVEENEKQVNSADGEPVFITKNYQRVISSSASTERSTKTPIRAATSHSRYNRNMKAPNHALPNYSGLKSVVGNLVRMLGLKRMTKSEFEVFRRKIRMSRRLPTFVGLKEPKNESSSTKLEEELQGICCKYARRFNGDEAIDDISKFVSENPECADLFLREVEKVANERDEIDSSKEKRPIVDKHPWMDPKTVNFTVVQFSESGGFSAKLSPMHESSKLSTGGSSTARSGRALISLEKDATTLRFDDILLISHYVPIELVNEVLDDAKKY